MIPQHYPGLLADEWPNEAGCYNTDDCIYLILLGICCMNNGHKQNAIIFQLYQPNVGDKLIRIKNSRFWS